MNIVRPDLGLGILLAASLSPQAIMRIFNCDMHAANAFKEQAVGDLVALNSQIAKARGIRH